MGLNLRVCSAAVLLAVLAGPARGLPADDPVFKAMADELDRTMHKLKMPDNPGPYFASYAVREATSAYIEASFGSIVYDNANRFLDINVNLRAGGYAFDNTNFLPGGYQYSSVPGQGSASFESDYDNLRFALWSLSDEAYKGAVEGLAKKKAFREKRMIVKTVDDMSREKPVQRFDPAVPFTFDHALWQQRMRTLSEVFRQYPDIQDSRAAVTVDAGTKRLLNSEGTAVRGSDLHIIIEMTVQAQAQDGLRLGDGIILHYPSWADVPGPEALAGEARRLAQGMVDMAHGSTVQAYVGPVLFEEQAAAEFFDVFLVDNMSNPRGKWMEDEGNHTFDPPPLAGRLGMRVAVPFLSFVDDPLLERYQGAPLFGHYRIDDEGVPAQRLEIVRKGKLDDLYMSRAPIPERRHSNGHGRAGFFGEPSGRMGNLIVTPDSSLPLAELRQKLRAMCRELDLEYGIVVRRMGGLNPIVAYKLYAADGREEALRGVEFTGAGLRPLRDIVAASSQTYVFNFYHGSPGRSSVPASIVAPSILVDEMELKNTERKPERLPYLPHPYFAGQAGK
ncbi:MAG: metallopeptidase TldD-related protein [Elusimicrobiota bacterium]|jgi:predicted Zn-dependent protease